MREYNWAFENNWFQNKSWPFFDRVSTAPFFFLFFFLFFTTRQCPSYACDTLYWFCYPLMRAHRGRIVGGVLFLAKCVSHVLSTRVSLSSRNIHVFHALVYSLPVFIPVSFFVCEHPQIHSLRRIILLIRYSHFFTLFLFFWSIIDILTTLTTFGISTIIHLEFI